MKLSPGLHVLNQEAGKGKKCERDGDSLISWKQFGSPNPLVSGSMKQ